MDGRAASHTLMPVLHAIFFPRDIFFTFFSFWFIYGGLVLELWGSGIESGFWGWGFQLIGFEACDVELSGSFGIGALYITIK
mgnify:CR=1 FL=1